MDCGGFILRVKRQVRDAKDSPPSSAKVNNGGAIPPLLSTGTDIFTFAILMFSDEAVGTDCITAIV
jgi:hypothetical protein